MSVWCRRGGRVRTMLERQSLYVVLRSDFWWLDTADYLGYYFGCPVSVISGRPRCGGGLLDSAEAHVRRVGHIGKHVVLLCDISDIPAVEYVRQGHDVREGLGSLRRLRVP